MQSSRFAPLLILLTFQLLQGCSSPASNVANNSTVVNAANAAQAGPKDNVEELGMLVRLPFVPEEVAWEENPQQKTLTAVLRFSSEDAERMLVEASKGGQGAPDTVATESWYPNELIAQGELSGESTVKGRSFPAEPFLNPPYTKGKITRVENTDYFILQISS